MIGDRIPDYVEGVKPGHPHPADDLLLDLTFHNLLMFRNACTIKNIGWREASACIRGERSIPIMEVDLYTWSRVQNCEIPPVGGHIMEPITDFKDPAQLKLRLDILLVLQNQPITPITRLFTKTPLRILFYNLKSLDPHNQTIWSNRRNAFVPNEQNSHPLFRLTYVAKMEALGELFELGINVGSNLHRVYLFALINSCCLYRRHFYLYSLPGMAALNQERQEERAGFNNRCLEAMARLVVLARAERRNANRPVVHIAAHREELRMRLEVFCCFDPLFVWYTDEYFEDNGLRPLRQNWDIGVKAYKLVLEMYYFSMYMSASQASIQLYRLGRPARNPFALTIEQRMRGADPVLVPEYVAPVQRAVDEEQEAEDDPARPFDRVYGVRQRQIRVLPLREEMDELR